MFSSELFRFQRLINKLGTQLNGVALVTVRQVTNMRNQVAGTTSSTTVDTLTPGIIGEYEGEFVSREDVTATLTSVLIKGEGSLDSNGAPLVPKVGDQVQVNNIWMRVLHVIPGYLGPRLASYELVASI